MKRAKRVIYSRATIWCTICKNSRWIRLLVVLRTKIWKALNLTRVELQKLRLMYQINTSSKIERKLLWKLKSKNAHLNRHSSARTLIRARGNEKQRQRASCPGPIKARNIARVT